MYLGDLWPESAKEDYDRGGEPDWVLTEREHFSKHRDKDLDGFMNHEEVKNWISPPDYDHTNAEAKHLIYEADIDKVMLWLIYLNLIHNVFNYYAVYCDLVEDVNFSACCDSRNFLLT
jgi:hypothetical protein